VEKADQLIHVAGDALDDIEYFDVPKEVSFSLRQFSVFFLYPHPTHFSHILNTSSVGSGSFVLDCHRIALCVCSGLDLR